MTEAGGLIVAAIIAGAVTIIAAIIAALVSFLTLVISKEQSVSEFRQQWIDELRKDIAIIVGRIIAIHGASIKHKDEPEKLWATVKPDWTGFHRVIVRIRLRLNPDEAGEKEGPATKAVLKAFEELESIFKSQKPQFHELDSLVKTLVGNAQTILKENWDRVREGEPVYRRTKWGMFIFAAAGATASAVAVIGYVGLRLFEVVCH